MSQATFNPRHFNTSGNPPFASVLEQRLSRREVLRGGFRVAAATMLGAGGLAGCGNAADGPRAEAAGKSVGAAPAPVLGFESIAGSRTDAVSVPEGYRAQVLAPWGTPLNAQARRWQADGSNSASDQANAVGMHHDGMHYFPIEGSASDGLLVINHEYIDQDALHPSGATTDASTGKRTSAEEIRKEINAHGVTVVRVRRDTSGHWTVVRNDPLNRRYTGATPMIITGPVAGSAHTVTRYSTWGGIVRGTLNNCGNGYTPWGTYLTCEENWPEYFVHRGAQPAQHRRIGIDDESGRYGWEHLAGHNEEIAGEFSRFDITPVGPTAADDYRNEANGYGYIVEIDPYTPNATAMKRSALGRFRHEGCWPARPGEGKPVVFYSGHDGRGEYIYKFVSAAVWDPADANPADRIATGHKYLDSGVLYVARFHADGTGDWQALLTTHTALTMYASQADLILDTLGAADKVGATPMDRPEWGAVDPITGAVYFTLTNNANRGSTGSRSDSSPNARAPVDAANPRARNENGHIIRWTEDPDDVRRFNWDIFVFGAPAGAPASVNRSGLGEMNQFASPDGLVFDPRGILWIQTDNGADDVAQYTNDQMLAVVPAGLTEDPHSPSAINAANQPALRRFFVGPNDCEVTGLAFNDDYSAFFANIQHPGNWPGSEDAAQPTPEGRKVRPRAATVVLSRLDGGPVGV